GGLDLTFLDVHAPELAARERLAEDPEHGTHAAPDLEESRAWGELRSREDQLLTPVLRLCDQALLLVDGVAVDVFVGHSGSVGATLVVALDPSDATSRDLPRLPQQRQCDQREDDHGDQTGGDERDV